MKNLILFIVCCFLITSCSNDEIIMDLETQDDKMIKRDAHLLSKKKSKINVCHKKAGIISINESALNAHLAHGDAVDRDGDGFFNIENSCSEVDCDDETYSENNTCDVIFKSFHNPIGWQFVTSGTSDNFEHFDITVCSDFGESGCVLSSPRLTQEGNVSTYDGGNVLGPITLTFIGYDPGTQNPIYDIETLAYPSWNNVLFVKRDTYSASCFDCESQFEF
ncbi:MAG: hypothetical protein HKN40_13445 [Winogradskyella sp.]|uniref:hypothetical protein n=1 Tax=Winogradskyella sp. TaxID=1883156 RepID=UPI0017B33112|nr:hypothetical protein [Winogradskyella sp.]